MKKFEYITLREKPEIAESAAEWFSKKWNIPKAAYLKEMKAYLEHKTEYGWYLCLFNNKIVGGLGIIENDFHNRKDLAPNVCAVYTEEAFRKKGIAGHLLNKAVQDMKEKGITPIYLVADIKGFYEKYGWEYFCPARSDGEDYDSRLYIHR